MKNSAKMINSSGCPTQFIILSSFSNVNLNGIKLYSAFSLMNVAELESASICMDNFSWNSVKEMLIGTFRFRFLSFFSFLF